MANTIKSTRTDLLNALHDVLQACQKASVGKTADHLAAMNFARAAESLLSTDTAQRMIFGENLDKKNE